jgi:hypothetical protein
LSPVHTLFQQMLAEPRRQLVWFHQRGTGSVFLAPPPAFLPWLRRLAPCATRGFRQRGQPGRKLRQDICGGLCLILLALISRSLRLNSCFCDRVAGTLGSMRSPVWLSIVTRSPLSCVSCPCAGGSRPGDRVALFVRVGRAGVSRVSLWLVWWSAWGTGDPLPGRSG